MHLKESTISFLVRDQEKFLKRNTSVPKNHTSQKHQMKIVTCHLGFRLLIKTEASAKFALPGGKFSRK